MSQNPGVQSRRWGDHLTSTPVLRYGACCSKPTLGCILETWPGTEGAGSAREARLACACLPSPLQRVWSPILQGPQVSAKSGYPMTCEPKVVPAEVGGLGKALGLWGSWGALMNFLGACFQAAWETNANMKPTWLGVGKEPC